MHRPIRPTSIQRPTDDDPGYTARADEGEETKTPVSGNACLGFSLPLLRPLAVGSEFQRDRGHPRAPHEEVQYAEHAAPNSKAKGTNSRRDARAAGT
jgi:hypothetical protein